MRELWSYPIPQAMQQHGGRSKTAASLPYDETNAGTAKTPQTVAPVEKAGVGKRTPRTRRKPAPT
jgi:hypothetical protein